MTGYIELFSFRRQKICGGRLVFSGMPSVHPSLKCPSLLRNAIPL